MPEKEPQFGTAEYAATPGADQCRSCGRTISGVYYRVNGALACESCTERAKQTLPKDSHAAFVRGLLFGAGGAILGLILYAAFGIITGLMIGYVSLAVGYIVGKAMMKGSGGIGGRRYQVAALLLTYGSVSMAAVPIGISQYVKQEKEKKQVQSAKAPEATSESAPGENAAPQKSPTSLGAALLALALLGLASPFLELQDPVHGLIGLVILAVGLQIAWKITAGKPPVEIVGPFKSHRPPPPVEMSRKA